MGSTESEVLRSNVFRVGRTVTNVTNSDKHPRQPGELLLVPKGEPTSIADATKYLNSQELPLLPQVFPTKKWQ